jgi:ribosomal protein S13
MVGPSIGRLIRNQNYGTSSAYLGLLESRLELFSSNNLGILEPQELNLLIALLKQAFPSYLLFRNRLLLSIIFLDLAYSYRGWRHLKGLPVRGQRTWSNASNSAVTNKVLREHKQRLGRVFFGRTDPAELRVMLLSEYINSLWEHQWYSE